MNGQARSLTPKEILAEKVSLREKQARLILRKQQREARAEEKKKAETASNVTPILQTDTGIEIKLTTITPEMATGLLEYNTDNRPINDQHVHRIARQISDGKWKFNGDTIKVSDDKEVLDGQHRLWATIEANKPIETVVVYGVKRDAFATIDTLRKARSGADVLAINGQTRYRNIASTALQWLIRWQRITKENNVLLNYKAPQNRIENSDIEAAWKTHPHIIDAVERAMKLRRLTNPSLLAFFYYVLSNRDPVLAESMMSVLDDPSGTPGEHPFYLLRSYFHSDHLKRKEPIQAIAMMTKAANLAKANKRMKNLVWLRNGNEKFPVLDV